MKSQFPLLEEALAALGVAVWPMVEYEADDALAAAAASAARSPDVERVVICTPDKDLAQSVRGTRVVQMIRRTRTIRDEAGVRAKFGVGPESIPDYLALVGDSSDGYPGLPGWGEKSAAAVLAKFIHLEAIPDDPATWPEPTAALALEDAQYGMVQVQAWAGVEYRARTIAGVNVLNAGFMTGGSILLALLQHAGVSMPVLFAARDGSAVGAAHAGWRGLAGGVLEETVRKLAVPPQQLIAWLGPTIGQAHFEVGDDVLQR